MLHAFVNCAKTVLPSSAIYSAMVLTKCLRFFIFQLPKAEQGPLRTYQFRKVEFPKLK
jgi:hypothetical protein